MFGDRQLPHAKYELLIENKRQVKLNLSCEKVLFIEITVIMFFCANAFVF